MAALAVVVAVAVGAPSGDQNTASSKGSDEAAQYARPGTQERPSRSNDRPELPAKAEARNRITSGTAVADRLKAVGKRYVTTELNLWSGPGEDNDLVKVLPTGTKVSITDTTKGPWAQVIYKDKPRWVTAEYLSKKDPEKTAGSSSGGISGAPCVSGSEVESGLTENAVAVHRAVCAAFPEVDSYGGLRADSGEHGTGQALDIMVSDSSLGDQIADYVRSHAGELGVTEVIWYQQIWTTQRSSEGWRPMEDRGSPTANHMDHVHVTAG